MLFARKRNNSENCSYFLNELPVIFLLYILFAPTSETQLSFIFSYSTCVFSPWFTALFTRLIQKIYQKDLLKVLTELSIILNL